MIEVIYKDEKSGEENEFGFYLPRNIRQIGLIHENYRIYMEDYVYTFLGKAAALTMKTERLGRAAILTGEIRWKEGVTYVFIQGAVLLEETELALDHILIEAETWDKTGKECERYFAGQEVVGWFFTQQGLPIRATEILTRAHVKYFGGEKVLFLMEPTEKEDAFFRFENSFLVKQSGYYLYYEKNQPMQNYMLAKNELLSMNIIEKTEDEAVKTFRKIIQDKNESKEEKGSLFSYAATACLVLMVGAVGVRFYQSYQEMQSYGLVQETETANSFQAQPVLTEKATVTPTPKSGSAVETALQKEILLQVTEKAKKEISLIATPLPTLGLGKTETAKTQAVNGETVNAERADVQAVNKETVNTEGSDAQAVNKETVNTEGSDAQAANTETLNTETQAGSSKTEKREAAGEKEILETTGSVGKTEPFNYVVRPGDSLFQISLEHYGAIDIIPEICELNGFSEDEVIYPGQIIVLP